MKSLRFSSRLLLFVNAGVLAVGLSSCYPGSIDLAESDIVITNFDDNYFAVNTPQTYILPDSVGVIGDGDPQLDRAEMDFILAQIARNFDQIGYTRLTVKDLEEGASPDVIVLASSIVIKVTGTGCIPYWPGWGWWPGWGYYPPGWGGWCYPTYLYSYTTGTLTIDMIDPQGSTSEEINRVWNAGLNGILRNDVTGNENFIREGVDKAFELSHYLNP
jgi:hypothetical protein